MPGFLEGIDLCCPPSLEGLHCTYWLNETYRVEWSRSAWNKFCIDPLDLLVDVYAHRNVESLWIRLASTRPSLNVIEISEIFQAVLYSLLFVSFSQQRMSLDPRSIWHLRSSGIFFSHQSRTFCPFLDA